MQRLLVPSLVTILIVFSYLSAATAQSSHRGLVSSVSARRAGLQKAWTTRVLVDSSRGGIGHIRQHVSSSRSYTVYQVVYEGGKINFSERDLDRFGDRLGKEEAEKQATQKVEELKKRQLSPQLKTHAIPQITLYVTTTRGLIQAIDAETGRTRWATEVGDPDDVAEAPGANDDFVVAVNGTQVFILDTATGAVAWQHGTRGMPGAGPAVTDRYLFLPMVNGSIESYTLDDQSVPPWVFRSHGRTTVQPISTGSVVAWPTDNGDLNVAEANSRNILYRIETNDSIVSPATALPGQRLLTASTDGYVYCVHALSGAMLWRFSTGEPIRLSPIAIGESIYVVTEEGSMFRLNSRTGLEDWWSPRIYGFAAASSERLYCFDRSGKLVILHAETGARVGSLNTQTLDVHLANKQTDRLFLGDSRGVIQCLHEPNRDWPLLHIDLTEAAPQQEERPRPRRDRETPTPPPGDRDPFGGAGGSDPFGSGDAGGSDPFGGGSGGSDPFGGSGDSDPFGGGTDGTGGTGETGGADGTTDPFGADPFK